MKKNVFLISFILTIVFSLLPVTYVQAADDSDDSWVKNAFNAADSFLKEPVKDDLGIANNVLKIFKKIVRAINRILLVALFGLSAISLSVIGIRYMISGNAPHQRENAKKSLHTVLMGMVYGFGAFAIWRIAMSIVSLIIGTFAQ